MGTHIGKTIYFASGLPGTNDKTGFEALTWVKATGVQQAFQFGVDHANIDEEDLETGMTNGLKGAGSGSTSEAAFRSLPSDAGQVLMKELAHGLQGLCSVKIGKGSATDQALVAGDPVEYAQGYLSGYKKVQPAPGASEGVMVSFKQNAFSIVDVEPS